MGLKMRNPPQILAEESIWRVVGGEGKVQHGGQTGQQQPEDGNSGGSGGALSTLALFIHHARLPVPPSRGSRSHELGELPWG